MKRRERIDAELRGPIRLLLFAAAVMVAVAAIVPKPGNQADNGRNGPRIQPVHAQVVSATTPE